MKTIDLFGRPLKSGQRSVLGKRFRWPPFSVMNARDGDWQSRKREWVALGIQSELGRGENLLKFSDSVSFVTDGDGKKTVGGFGNKPPSSFLGREALTEIGQKEYRKELDNRVGGKVKSQAFRIDPDGYHPDRREAIGRPQNKQTYQSVPGRGNSHSTGVWLTGEGSNKFSSKDFGTEDNISTQTGTSIFDPVICELVYRWFIPSNAIVLDPFSGGSVRGIVASVLGRTYVGVDLRPEQIRANDKQAEKICKIGEEPIWLEGDSRNIVDIVNDIAPKFSADFILSCPPYFDLELYSGDERDLSNTTWEKFCDDYFFIIKESVSLLKDNRFACFVVGDVRDKQGFYRNLPAVTIDCFEKAGCRLYNEALLITAVGSLPLRIHKQFTKSRKLGRTHQSVLIFVKGDPVIAAKACEDLDLLSIDVMNFSEECE